jgi:hypothetical protein
MGKKEKRKKRKWEVGRLACWAKVGMGKRNRVGRRKGKWPKEVLLFF